MCRFLAYRGSPILINELLYEPRNSLINQSFAAREREEPLNGDGFGIGWYNPEVSIEPAVFVSITPAWNNRNLRYLAKKLKTPCLFAHVRAATASDVSEASCHPFQFNEMLMMHNGDIGGFAHIKRTIQNRLSDTVFNWLKGHTDSEHFFALFLDKVIARGRFIEPAGILEALEETVGDICELQRKAHIDEPNYLNVAITDGWSIVALRCTTDADGDADTLYYSEGSRFTCESGICRMQQAEASERAVLVVSEKLTDVRSDWKEIPVNHALIVREDLNCCVSPLQSISTGLPARPAKPSPG
ncbi:MAG: class II glutamine amidotransferase [Bdellovibrionales bacterium]|nr:class II glutamine amidotransferase [Bdellovibrionales bacterium]